MSTLKTNNIQHVDRSDPSIIISTDGGVSIAGTLTYEDVTSVDAVGIVTAREILNAQKQVHVGTGVSVKAGGLNVTAGITTVQALQATTGAFSGQITASDHINLASGKKLSMAGDVFKVYHSTNAAIINESGDLIINQNVSNKDIKISTGSGPTECIRITSAGKVGIGTDMGGTPASSYPLSVYRATGTGYLYTETAQSTASAGLRAKAGAADYTIFTTEGTGQLAVYDNTNTNQRITLDSSGRLLLGTTTEGFATADNFTISDTTTDCGMTIRAGTSSQSIIAFSDATSGTGEYAGYLSYYHNTDELHIGAVAKPIVKIHNEYFNILADEGTTRLNFGFTDTNGGELSIYDDAGAQKVRICGSTNTDHFFNNGGDVGIGTNNPSGLTHWVAPSDMNLYLRSDNASGTIRWNYQDEGGTVRGHHAFVNYGNNENDYFTWYTHDGSSIAERFKILKGGQIIINGASSTSPDGFNSLLQVNSANHEGSITVGRHTANSNGPALIFHKSRSGTATPGSGALSSGDTLGILRFYGSDGNDRNSFAANIACEVDGAVGTDDLPGRLILSTTRDGHSTSTERLRIDQAGVITSTYPTLTTVQATPVTNTSGDRFAITLPDNSRMVNIKGSFSFDNTGTYKIWGDFGDWSDSHTASLEGASQYILDGGSEQTQDDISGRYFSVATPVDCQCLEVTYDITITTMAFFHGGGDNQGGARPGISGTLRFTSSGTGNALSTFSYQDTNAKATDRLVTFTWDIDGVSGSVGTGKHHYVMTAYPLTGDAQNLGDAA